MNKKTYIAPEVAVEVLEVETLMVATSDIVIEPDDERVIAGRRGSWGNRWE